MMLDWTYRCLLHDLCLTNAITSCVFFVREGMIGIQQPVVCCAAGAIHRHPLARPINVYRQITNHYQYQQCISKVAKL